MGTVVLGVEILATGKSRNRLHRVVSQISQANAQVVMKRLGNADCKAQAEQALRKTEHPEIVIAAEESAANDAPGQSSCRENEVGKMS